MLLWIGMGLLSALSISTLAGDDDHFIFPKGFLWGTATAAHQVEGGLNNDWTEWESRPGNIANGDTSELGVDHYHRFDEDFTLARTMGNNAHRISIEWSRIEPARGVWDHQAIAHYHEVFRSMRRHGLEPFVTLHHFTHPKWIARQGGWLSPQTIRDFTRFARFVGAEYPEVRYWITINEPNIYALETHLIGAWPPQHRNPEETMQVMSNLAHAHVLAYHALHRVNPTCFVGIAHHVAVFDPYAWWSPLDQVVTYFTDQIFNRAFLKAITKGEAEFRYPGIQGVLLKDSRAKSALDFIGINYYTRWLCRGFDRVPHPAASQTAMGWEIYPEGMYRVLKMANEFSVLPDGREIPILITENGMDDRGGDIRSAFLVEHLKQVARAIQEGVWVVGYLHWSLMDNFEWASGYAPHFGLYSVDRRPGRGLKREPKPAVAVFQSIIERNGW